MIETAICAPTYNDHERITNLITSIYNYTDPSRFKMVILDDGTPDKKHVIELKKLSEDWQIPLILNDKNKGIPYCWNRLTEYYDAEYIIMFNDDIQVRSLDWLDAFLYFMKENKPGSVGFPLLHINPNTGKRAERYDPPNEDLPPGRVGSPVGCSFGFRKEHWTKVKQPDGSIGFYEDLVSFYEELDFNFELAKAGHDSYMMPYPAMEHWGSQTFAKNPELSVRPFSEYLPKDEYLNILRKAPKLDIPLENHIDVANRGYAYRMNYARMMFAKKWGCTDYYDIPQMSVHQKLVDPFPHRQIKWLGINKEKKEHEI